MARLGYYLSRSDDTEDVLELEYEITDYGMLHIGDSCIVLTTIHMYGWLTSQVYLSAQERMITVPGSSFLEPKTEFFNVVYPSLGSYTFRLEVTTGTFTIEPTLSPTPGPTSEPSSHPTRLCFQSNDEVWESVEALLFEYCSP